MCGEKMSNPKLSICIPTFNRANIVYKTVMSCLQYDNPDIEVVVSDNCSDDNTESVLSKISDNRFKYYKNNYNNGTNNLISVLTYATGEYLLLTSDEDAIVIENMDKIMTVLQKINPAVLKASASLFGKEYVKHRNGCYNAGFEAIRAYGCGSGYMSGYVFKKSIMDMLLDGMYGTDIDSSRFGYAYNFTNLTREMLQYGSLCFREEVITNQIGIGKRDMGIHFYGGKLCYSPEMRFITVKEMLNSLARVDLTEKEKYIMCEQYLIREVLNIHIGEYITTYDDNQLEKLHNEPGSELIYEYYVNNRRELTKHDIFNDINQSVGEYIEYIDKIGLFKEGYNSVQKKYLEITEEFKMKKEKILNDFRIKKELIDKSIKLRTL